MTTPHDILGVPAGASREEIDAAYRRACMTNHPDRNIGDEGAAARMEAINAAYATLTGRVPVVDPVEQMALTILAIATAQAISVMLARGDKPRQQDVVEAIRRKLREDLVKAHQIEEGQEMGLRELESLAGRFSGEVANLLEDIVGVAILADSRRQLERTRAEIRGMERAVELLIGCAFRADKPAAGVWASTNGRNAMVNWQW